MSDQTDDDANWWEQAYRNDEIPWEVGRPQPALVGLADSDVIDGRVLDVGCGVGTESLYLADQGYDVTGIDFAEPAIERARNRARSRDTPGAVAFRTADALALSETELGPFETVIDCGMFHTVDSSDRAKYVSSLSSVLSADSRVILLEFGPSSPEDWPPNLISEADLRRSFVDNWRIETVKSAPFVTQQRSVEGILGVIRRTNR